MGKIGVQGVKFRLFSPGAEFGQVVSSAGHLFFAVSSGVISVYTLIFLI